jgi:hypothetical protein
MKTRILLLATLSAWAFADEGGSDHIAFPAGYAQQLRQQGPPIHNERSGVTTVYANELAVKAAKSGATHFPEGAVIVMEFAKPEKDTSGQIRLDAQGSPLKGGIEHVDVMRRGRVADENPNRAGHWSFASFGPDGKTLVAADNAAHCAACHRNAGADKDFVFRTRPWPKPE